MRRLLVLISTAALVGACGGESETPQSAENDGAGETTLTFEATEAAETEAENESAGGAEDDDDPQSEPPAPTFSEEDVEYRLAVIDGAASVDDFDNPEIRMYKRALDRLEKKCKEGRTKIADMSVRSTELLAEAGISESNLVILRAANDSIPRSFGETRCSDIFAALIVLMRG